MQALKGHVILKIERKNFGVHKINTPDGVIEIHIDTEFERAHHQTQFSEVVAVAEDEKEIKVGMMVFHNHNVFSDKREIPLHKDLYTTPRDFVFGTEHQMFGDFVMCERVFEEKEVVLGTVVNARVDKILNPSLSKCKVLTGRYSGSEMYCTDLMFYEIVGYDKKICIANKKQIVASLDLIPCEGKIIVIPETDDFVVKKDSKIIVKNNYQRPNLKQGNVFRSDDKTFENKKIAYLRFYQSTINNTVYHFVNTKDVECIINDIETFIPIK